MSASVLPDPAALEALAGLGLTLDPVALSRLETLRSLLEEWQDRMNLVGPSTLPQFWMRHVVDSAQLLHHAGPEGLRGAWLDMGAGAGFPGLVLAAFGAQRLTLVDSIAKKCRFLEAAREAMGVVSAVMVQNARLEQLSPISMDFVTARACAPLAKLLSWGYPFSRETTRWLLLKGQDIEAELIEASKSWVFVAHQAISVSDPRGRILCLEQVRPRPQARKAVHGRSPVKRRRLQSR
jgi:16S rRNA (guanine527-N7)-methyltransferase